MGGSGLFSVLGRGKPSYSDAGPRGERRVVARLASSPGTGTSERTGRLTWFSGRRSERRCAGSEGGSQQQEPGQDARDQIHFAAGVCKVSPSPGRAGRLLGDAEDAGSAAARPGLGLGEAGGAGRAAAEEPREAGQRGRPACGSEAGCSGRAFRGEGGGGGGGGGRRGGTGGRWREGGSTRPGMELQSGGSERGRP